MKNKKGFSVILIIAIGAIVATFGWIAYATWQQSVDDSNFTLTLPFVKHKAKTTNTNSAANTNTFSNTNAATNTNVSTATSLKTYTNTKYGFSFQYPNTWKTDGADGLTIGFTPTNDVVTLTSDQLTGGGGKDYFCVDIRVSTDDYDLTGKAVKPGRGTVATLDDGLKIVEGWGGYEYKTYVRTWLTNNNMRSLIPLANGKKLLAQIIYSCAQGDVQDSTLSYSQQVASAQYTAALNVLKSLSVDETFGWKTYTNTTFLYSIKYPGTYTQTGTAKKMQLQKGELAGNTTHRVLVYTHDGTEQGWTTEEKGWFTWALQGFPTSTTFANKRTVKLGENTFTAFDFDPASGGGLTVDYFLVKGSIVYLLSDFRVGDHANDTNKDIIATFIPNETLGWKTYTNTTHKFSFKYPSTGTVVRETVDALRIQNYTTTDDNYQLKTGDFYLELYIDNNNPSGNAIASCEDAVDNGVTATFGSKTGLQGVDKPGPHGPNVLACVESTAYDYKLKVTEGTGSTKVLGKSILSTFTFTK